MEQRAEAERPSDPDVTATILEALASSPDSDAPRLATLIATDGLERLPVTDQFAAIRITAISASHLDSVRPETAAAQRRAAVAASGKAGIRVLWGAEPNLDAEPTLTHLRAHGDGQALDAVQQHLDLMRREAHTGVMLIGYDNPHAAEAAQRQRFIDHLITLGLPHDVINQIRSNPLNNRPEVSGESHSPGPSNRLSEVSRRPPPPRASDHPVFGRQP